MTEPGQKFFMGKVVGFQGLAGEVKVSSATNSPQLMLAAKVVTVHLASGKIIELSVRGARVFKSNFLMSFVDHPDRTSVEPLMGAKIFMEQGELGTLESNEWWESDLVGVSVYKDGNILVGTVSGVIHGPTAVLEITPATAGGATLDKKILVPFVKALVPMVDMKGKRLEVVDIPGLLEPQ